MPCPGIITKYGDPRISTDKSRFGGSSLRLSNNNYITISNDWTFDGNFTIEFWLYIIGSNQNDRYIIFENNTGNSHGLINNNNNFSWNIFGSGNILSTSLPSLGEWHHIAFVKNGSTSTMYIDGEYQADTGENLIPTNATILSLGASTNDQYAATNCYIDQLRVSTGALYTDDFVVPTVEYIPDLIPKEIYNCSIATTPTPTQTPTNTPTTTVTQTVTLSSTPAGTPPITPSLTPYSDTLITFDSQDFINNSNNSLNVLAGGVGSSVELSDNGQTIAIGAAPYSLNRGAVQVYTLDSSVWIQKGNNIVGPSALHRTGYSIALSDDGEVMAIGSLGYDMGYVKVYYWDDPNWVQQGSTIFPSQTNDLGGSSISLNGDGSIVAIGTQNNSDSVAFGGSVKVYSWSGTAWVQQGSTIYGGSGGNWGPGGGQIGRKVKLNNDGTKLAIGGNKGIGVYSWDSTSWSLLGSRIIPSITTDNNGHVIRGLTLDNSGDLLGLGIYGDNQKGLVQTYYWDGTSWEQKGTNIVGNNNDRIGYSISFSNNGDTMAVGAIGPYETNPNTVSYVKIYKWSNTENDWIQYGNTIYGDSPADATGSSLSFNSDGSILAIGAMNRGLGAGGVRILEIL